MYVFICIPENAELTYSDLGSVHKLLIIPKSHVGDT